MNLSELLKLLSSKRCTCTDHHFQLSSCLMASVLKSILFRWRRHSSCAFKAWCKSTTTEPESSVQRSFLHFPLWSQAVLQNNIVLFQICVYYNCVSCCKCHQFTVWEMNHLKWTEWNRTDTHPPCPHHRKPIDPASFRSISQYEYQMGFLNH